ncbi:hypothetical protein ACIOMM_13320 [Streptomyces sp. NPDC087908]|uniref:hypothetical protein n=1 Tax=Streptomyces sp. NPDC087908 TaxID=3365820 RepID=UPI0037FC1429
MSNRRVLGALALLLAAGTTACSSGPTYDDSAKECRDVLVSRPAEDTGKPKECEPLGEEDYTALVAAVAVERLGWTDENGEFDENRMREDALDD